MTDLTSIQVALRIRPLVQNEIAKGCKNILEVYKDYNQIKIKGYCFTYNYIFDCDTSQNDFYMNCISPVVPNLFNGYNVTILAYGQTGSGKTHSMGTNYNGSGEMGVIPKVLNEIFNHIKCNQSTKHTVTVSFIELYQEVLYDLLANKSRSNCCLDIREDSNGIQIPGLTELTVGSSVEALEQLINGSEKRAVGSTNMNKQSSRSHAVFTITIIMQGATQKTAKFHLVDLAGSERSKKTGATGTTFKEGVNINKGLLALGNVISALGDDKYNQGFISYRDSNLTRLLKDSLGGNSLTLMIACVSPADYNLEETVSTLRYADRAKKIKNKPIVNEDPKAAEINKLKQIVDELRLELGGKGTSYVYHNTKQIELEDKCNKLMLTLSSTLTDKASLHEKLMNLQTSNEKGINALNNIINKLDTLRESNETSDGYHDMKSDLETLGSYLKNNNDVVDNDDVLLNGKDMLTELAIKEKQESYTNNQMALNEELEKVSKMITMKEYLAKQMTSNAQNIVDLNAFMENEEKIIQLEHEKAEILTQFKSSKQKRSKAESDEKKKEIQELERKIEELKKKVTEQSRLIKLKKKDEEKINDLNRDILSLKQTKIKLVKSMREESDRFRKWKMEKERELTKLKNQNIKKDNEIVRMERLHSRQQNVLRRKIEEATAINKRLKDSLALRKLAKEQHTNSHKKIGQWIQDELELYLNIIDARSSLEVLIEDRTLLQEELDILKNNSISDLEQIINLENEIEVRSAQISDFQNKLLDSDEESKFKTRWDNIHTMGDAKQALQILLNKIAEIRKRGCLGEIKTNELKALISEHDKRNDNLIKQLKEQESFFKTELNNIERNYAEKISILLHQLHSKDVETEEVDDEESNKFKLQLELIDNLQARVKELEDENGSLQCRVNDINRIILSGKKKKKSRIVSYKLRGFDDEETDYEDDKARDPDWRNTPLAKSLREMKNKSVNLEGERKPVKRKSNDGCTCKRNCSTKSCKCRKLFSSCTIDCRCRSENCVNRTTNNDENVSNTSNESFKKAKIDGSTLNDADFLTPKRNLSKCTPFKYFDV